jgi:23S rRNA-/tRNA-specific pseudouridylate synthase
VVRHGCGTSNAWRVVARDALHGDLVELELVGPGRRHQLRASCAHLGHPLVGDALYRGATADSVRLHAWKVEIDGVTVEAPAPPWACTHEPRDAG